MKRRAVLELAAMAALAAMFVAPRCFAQSSRKPFRIGMLLVTNRAITQSAGNLQPFERALREYGYVEGRNLMFEWRAAEGRMERLPALAAELVALKVDVIVAGAEAAAVAAKNATKTIPVVFVSAGDPVALGLVKTLSRPGGNVTGFSSFGETLVPKRVELLREIFPQLTRLAVLHQPDDSPSMQHLRATRALTDALKLSVSVHEIKASAEIETALKGIENDRPEALMVFPSSLTFIHRKRISGFAAQHRLPVIFPFGLYLDHGGLMSYGFSYPDNYRRTAEYVDRIFKGARPAELPVQQPVKFELVINLRAAEELGIKIPASLRLRADRVIE
jgi:putative ABC transport system substrate-binding protein